MLFFSARQFDRVVRQHRERSATGASATMRALDQTQLETLMAHGLAPEEAIDVIVTGVLQ
ncbi:MAG: hypothetical protein HYU73_27745 [Betaproteobacteria bacterium]|nr:hypothetical protein [Betaproteobacteria bacterium]